jgi:hypothetical protein
MPLSKQNCELLSKIIVPGNVLIGCSVEPPCRAVAAPCAAKAGGSIILDPTATKSSQYQETLAIYNFGQNAIIGLNRQDE